MRLLCCGNLLPTAAIAFTSVCSQRLLPPESSPLNLHAPPRRCPPQMIAAMRPDIDNVDEYVRNTTARAFSVVASALGIPAMLPFLKAVCASKKSWQASGDELAIAILCCIHRRQLGRCVAVKNVRVAADCRRLSVLALRPCPLALSLLLAVDSQTCCRQEHAGCCGFPRIVLAIRPCPLLPAARRWLAVPLLACCHCFLCSRRPATPA